jgi:hypothetical protein
MVKDKTDKTMESEMYTNSALDDRAIGALPGMTRAGSDLLDIY